MELFYRQLRDGRWVCYDRDNRQAKGFTKELARNAYHIKFKITEELHEKEGVAPDFSKYFNGFNGLQ